MIDERFVIIAFVLTLAGSVHYLIDVLRGKAKPNKVTWFLWALAPMIAFAAQTSEGVGYQSLLTLGVGLGPILVFVGSFWNKQSYWKLRPLDFMLGGLSLVGLILWQITDEGVLAVIFSIVADGLAATPTILKSWSEPESESSFVYAVSSLGAVITLLAVKQWTFIEYGFSLYIFFICTLIYTLVKFRWGRRSVAHNH